MPDPAAPLGDASAPTTRAFWRALPGPAKWLLSTVVLGSLGRGLVFAFTAIYLHEVRGMALDTVGLLVGGAGVAAVAAAAWGGPLIDHRGARAALIACYVAAVAGDALLAFVSTPAAAAGAFALVGTSFGLAWPGQNAMASSLVSGGLRQQYFGVNFALVNLGIGAGGLLAGLFVDPHRLWTFQALFLVDAALLALPLVVLLGPLRAHPGRHAPDDGAGAPVAAGGYRAVWGHRAMRWYLVGALAISLIGYGQFEVGMPAFARGVSEISPLALGLAFGFNTGIIVVAQFAVMALSGAVWAVAWLGFGATGLAPGGIAAAAGVCAALTLFGLGETLMQPASSALVNELAPSHRRGRYNAAASGAFQSGAILAPLGSGALLHAGLPAVFIAVLVALCGAIVVAFLRMERLVTPRENGVGDDPGSSPT